MSFKVEKGGIDREEDEKDQVGQDQLVKVTRYVSAVKKTGGSIDVVESVEETTIPDLEEKKVRLESKASAAQAEVDELTAILVEAKK